MKFELNSIFQPAATVFRHELEGETILVSVAAGAEQDESDVLKLNGTGRAVWGLLDGKRDLQAVLGELAGRFAATEQEISHDTELFLGELLRRSMLVVVEPSPPCMCSKPAA